MYYREWNFKNYIVPRRIIHYMDAKINLLRIKYQKSVLPLLLDENLSVLNLVMTSLRYENHAK